MDQPTVGNDPTINEILDLYLKDRKGRVASYATLMNAARNIRGHMGELTVSAVRRSTSRNYIDVRREQGFKDGNTIKDLTVLRAALSLAEKDDLITKAPYIEMPPRPLPQQRWLTHDEAEQLIAAARYPHIALYILLAIYTGARKSAILGLKWSKVHPEYRTVDYRLPGRPESNKRRVVAPTTNRLQEALKVARQNARTDYVIEFNGQNLKDIKSSWKDTLIRSGIEHCRPHDLRHTCATWLIQSGVPSREVARLIGDTEEMIEKVYGHHSPNYLQGAVRAFEEMR